MIDFISKIGNSNFIDRMGFTLLFVALYPLFESERDLTALLIGVITGVLINALVLRMDDLNERD